MIENELRAQPEVLLVGEIAYAAKKLNDGFSVPDVPLTKEVERVSGLVQ